MFQTLSAMQPDQSSGTGSSTAAPTPSDSNPSAGCAMNAGLMAVMFVVFYFFLIRPQQKRQKEHDSMLKALQKGDVVRTTGGIRGELVDLQEKDVTLQVADKVKINVLRSHIAGKDGGELMNPQAKG